MHGRVRASVVRSRRKGQRHEKVRGGSLLGRAERVDCGDGYIWRTSFPFISGLSTSHSSLKTAKMESAISRTCPRLQTSVMA